MALEGKFLVEVQKYVSELTEQKEALILDVATGAGETTLQIAEAMKGGKLITVDCDAASWEEWAKPSLRNAGVLGRVEFSCGDIKGLCIESNNIDLVVSDATLSAVNIWAVDAIKEFYRVLKSHGRAALRDLLCESETEDDPTNIALLDWRLAKAAAHIIGEDHYEELPAEWVKARLVDAGFEIVDFTIEQSRRPASEMSYNEWREIDFASKISDETLREAVQKAHNQLVSRTEKEGLSTKTGYYTCWVRKI